MYFFNQREKKLMNFMLNDTFFILVRDTHNNIFFFNFNIKNFSFKNEYKKDIYFYKDIYDTKLNRNNDIANYIENYFYFIVYISKYPISSLIPSDNIKNFIHTKSKKKEVVNFKHLWVQCENCYGLNYKQFFSERMNICEVCGDHLRMNSSDRINLLTDPGTWEPIGQERASLDSIDFHSEEDPYMDRIDFYKKKTGLNEAVQTGVAQINGIQIAMGVMEFDFMGGSMGSIVGEKITCLIEYATNQSLPIIIVCASGGARMQEGSLSLMQMAKISSSLYNYQLKKKLFYISILASPTTGGVTASFGMLGDIIIAEPNAYIAFAGKRVIEQILHEEVPDGSQEAENLFDKGLFDLIIPRNLLKGVLDELFQLHGFSKKEQCSVGFEPTTLDF
uniref:Acetyl-coenzyme A carboxylase carboxyl transferase subunit beta, chloroplastic n=2 Tax=Arachnitis uniflora TaxID=191246 RepID=A0A0K1H2F8_9LILI|nr:acetyl-CoA carboxylase carboxyltransferase beta subunit [Arachnitis uniflora]